MSIKLTEGGLQLPRWLAYNCRDGWPTIAEMSGLDTPKYTGKIPQRYSRHYYDLYKMYYSNVKNDALNNFGLLEDVRLFTMTFYNRAWAKFEEAKPGTFKLIPKNLDDLKNDYKLMESMFFKEFPSFDEVIDVLKKLENEINGVL